MMKSFFKKLAFVMALAMVVSAMAPAATAKAADAGLCKQESTTWEIIAKDELTEGASQDYKFAGAPKEWRTLGLKWTSSDPTVATVDPVTGLVKAEKAGTTTIKVAGGTYEASLELTVKAAVVETTYQPVQKSHNTMTFVFNKNVSYTIDDVELTKLYGEYPISWPISFFECKDNVVTISTYVDFEDGDKYIVAIGAEDEGTEFETTIGAIDEIKVSFKSTGKAAEEAGVAYAPLDPDDAEIPVHLEYELFSKGVNVTKARKYKDGEISYAFGVENDKADIDENVLYFEDYTAGVAVLVPTFTYEVDGEDVPVAGKAFGVPATPVPQYGIDSFVAWTIVKEADEKIDWTKPCHKFPAFDDAKQDHTIAVLVKDTLGKYYVFPEEAVANMDADDYKYGKNAVLLFDDIDETNEDASEYRLEFKSTNDNTLFVGNNDGSITTIGNYKTSVLVSLYDTNEDDDEYLVRHLTALTVNIEEERKVNKVTATVGFTSLPFVVNGVDKLREGKITFNVFDQHGDPYQVAEDKLEIKTTYDKEGFTEKSLTATAVANKVGVYETVVDAADYTYTKVVKGETKEVVVPSVKYTVKVKDTTAKDEFTVKVEEPKYDDNGDIKVEGYKATVSNIEQKIADSSKLGDLTKDIVVNEFSNDLVVGIKDEKIKLVTSDNEYKALLKDNKELVIKAEDAEIGDVFVVVYGPDGKAVSKNVVTGEAGQYKFCAAKPVEKTLTASSSAIAVMKYEAKGEYTVKVYTVEKEYASKNSKLEVVDSKFTVSNNNTAVTFDKQDVVDLTAEGALTIEAFVKKAFSFKFGDKALNEDEAYFVIGTDDYKYNEDSGRIFVYSVDIVVPLTNADGEDTYYEAGTIKINKYIEVTGLDQ